MAQQLDGEIVNADAMALYRGMDIGTAKPAPAERGGVVHHLLDVLAVTEPASVAAYQRDARAALTEIGARGHARLLVGGSGLYVSAVLQPLDFPGTDPAIRELLNVELSEHGPGPLHERLVRVDPAAAAAILPGNGRRIVRALEVVELSGAPFTARLPHTRAGDSPVGPVTVLGLDLPREQLDERIARRVAAMFAAGLVAETRHLVAAGLRRGSTAARALGYAQVLDLLDGKCDEAAAVAATVTATRRFARRQLSWFRRDKATIWLPADSPDLLERALAAVSRPTVAP